MPLNRRQLLASLSAGVAWGAAGCGTLPRPADPGGPGNPHDRARSLRPPRVDSYAAARVGCAVRFVALYGRPADSRADEMAARLAGAITPKTRAVGVTWVHSSTGV